VENVVVGPTEVLKPECVIFMVFENKVSHSHCLMNKRTAIK